MLRHLLYSRPLDSQTLSCPIYRSANNTPPFPLTILCRNDDEFNTLSVLARFINLAIRGWDLAYIENIVTQLEKLRDRPSTATILTKQRNVYVVFSLNGGRDIMCFDW